ncbi:MAG: acetyl-CoA C-acyltransferase [Saprospirales bacterium]|jgi:acetyl-CoA C-acetyltransferase|nr:acetyl-CoA C-acyltransferase [Saprospirales bacterium]
MEDVFIVSMARTPIGALSGVLANVNVIELGKIAVQAAMQRAGINGDQIDEVYLGNVLQANVGQAPAQQVSIAAGINTKTPCTTVNKVCASGMKAIMLGAQSIQLGDNDVVVVGGMESMSNAPHYLPTGRTGIRYGNGEILDAIVRDGLQDPYKKYMMGNAGEVCAKHYSFSREDQDAYAISSYKRAQEAYANGYFKDEIVPVVIASKKGDVTISEDEEYKKFDEAKVSALKPAFEKEGTITAINASKINDGASAMVLMSGKKVKELGVTPLAKIISFADASQDPEWFTTTPSKAIPKALHKANLKVEDVDFFEINEAFSVVALANMKEMNISHDKINVFGGAVALGHPIGNSGCRIVATLISILKNKDGKIGAAGICNGGGGASAIVIEKV